MKAIKFLIALISVLWAHSLAANGCDTYISSCQTLSTAGQTVCLSADIQSSASSNCITISGSADNMTLDCKGYRITRTASRANTGIYLASGADGVTVRDCEANHWSAGLWSQGNNGLIEYNKFFDNNDGIYLYHTSTSTYASGNEVAFNKLDDNDRGIRVRGNADGNYIHDNAVHGSTDQGIYCIRYTTGKKPDGNIFDRNQVNQNSNIGIYLYDCDDGWVTYNTANLNGDHGLYLTADSDGNVVSKNRFNRNGDEEGSSYGIYQVTGSSNTFGQGSEGNVCKNNKTAAYYPSDIDACK